MVEVEIPPPPNKRAVVVPIVGVVTVGNVGTGVVERRTKVLFEIPPVAASVIAVATPIRGCGAVTVVVGARRVVKSELVPPPELGNRAKAFLTG